VVFLSLAELAPTEILPAADVGASIRHLAEYHVADPAAEVNEILVEGDGVW